MLSSSSHRLPPAPFPSLSTYPPTQNPTFLCFVSQLADAGIIKKVDHNRPPLELERKRVSLETQLGSGNFGEVWKGTLLDDKKSAYVCTVEPLVAFKQAVATTKRVAANLDAHRVTFACAVLINLLPALLGMWPHALRKHLLRSYSLCRHQLVVL